MSFQRSAESLRAKLHLGDVKPVALFALLFMAGCIVAVAVCTVVMLVWNHAGSAEDASAREESALLVEGEDADSGTSVASGISGSDQPSAASAGEPAPASIFVHVSGEVHSPGLYELAEGSRVASAIESAGGATDGANLDAINLARVLADGEQVHVSSSQVAAASAGEGAGAAASGGTSAGGSQLVNINTATAKELTALDGIGEATAAKIVADRAKNGPFASKEDITRVSGIGQKKFEAIEERICV